MRLVWVNSPSNPTGRVLSAGQLAAAARAARDRGAVLASDECYIGLGWTAEPVSVLHPDVCGGSFDGLLAVHSVSKRSNLAGYRAGFVTGDPALVAQLLEIRKHAGMMMPTPVQAAMAAALADDAHAERQRSVYAARREQLRPALEKAGWTITHSEAGLYLWASRPGYDCWASVDLLAGAGILVAPGEFYGPAGAPAHPGGPHRHRRAGGRRRPPPGHPRLTRAAPGGQPTPSPHRPARRPAVAQAPARPARAQWPAARLRAALTQPGRASPSTHLAPPGPLPPGRASPRPVVPAWHGCWHQERRGP